ncbi:MAG: hypothetical protein ABL876_02990 [Chitinophagaceae bacterium]
MKKGKFLIAVVLIAITATAWKIVDDIITRLGMQQQTAQVYIMNNLVGRFSSGPMEGGLEGGSSNDVYSQLQSFQVPTARLLASIITGDKAGAAKDLCDYVRKYVNSEEFMTEYNRKREDAMPLTDKGMSLSSLKRNSEVFKLNIKNYPNDTKYVAEQQKQLDENQKRLDALLAAAKKPFPGKDLWEKAFPTDPAIIIKKRLQEYLQLVATVDFTAKLTGSGKKQTFVNPAYEKKSLKWKAAYRAGKEVNDVVTAFVKEWLKGEIISATKVKMGASGNEPSPAAKVTTPVSPAIASSPAATEPAPAPVEKSPESKPKKSLLNKIKEKAGTITGNHP